MFKGCNFHQRVRNEFQYDCHGCLVTTVGELARKVEAQDEAISELKATVQNLLDEGDQ